MLGGMVLYLSSATGAHTMEHMLSGMNPAVSHGGGLAMIFDAYHAVEASNVPQRYAQAADALGIGASLSENGKAEAFLDAAHEWKTSLGLDRLCLKNFGFTADQVGDMVNTTHWVGGGPLTRDRYRLTDEDLAEIFLKSMGQA